MKKYTLLALFLFVSLAAMAQSISVKSFKPLPMDMTASSLEGKMIDQNGDVAALIKVVTNETGFVFEGGTLGIVDTKQQVSEIWVWLPKASRKITIKHPQLGQLRDYLFPVEIEAERTYEMVLTTAKIETIIKEEVRQQFLAFKVSPSNATLEVNDDIWEVDADGNAEDFVNFGTYTYRVQAPNYHTDAGTVTVNDPDHTKFVTVTLSPNFGWIEVESNSSTQGASVYIDNVLLGKAPCKSDALKSGQHTVRIVKKMYATYSETVTVNDNQTTRISPMLSSDFAEVTLTVDADAEIWVNNERKGTRSWTGPLGSGTYKIECKQANHESTLTTKDITPSMNGQTIALTAPTPITGSLIVESTPKFCKLFIDGKDVGTTPKSVNEILIGQHQIRLTQDGYEDYTETITIEKGERKRMHPTLEEFKEDLIDGFVDADVITDVITDDDVIADDADSNEPPGVVYVIEPEPVCVCVFYFDFGSSTLKLNSKLNKLASNAFTQFLNSGEHTTEFEIIGHSDPREKGVSSARIASVENFIKSQIKKANLNPNNYEFETSEDDASIDYFKILVGESSIKDKAQIINALNAAPDPQKEFQNALKTLVSTKNLDGFNL